MRMLLGAVVASFLLPAVAAAADIEMIVDGARFPEGPEVIDGTLYYVEYGGHTIMTWDGKAATVFWTQEGCGPSAVLQIPGGDFLVTCYDSGTIGPNTEKRLTITKGSAEGNNVYIEAIVEGDNKLVLRLKLDGDKLVGDLKAEGPTAPPISGKMNLTKEK